MRYAVSNSLRIVNNVTDEEAKGFYKRSSIEGTNVNVGYSYITHRNNPIIDNNTKTWLSPNLSQDVPFTNGLYKDDLDYWPDGLDTSFANIYASETKYITISEMKDSILEYGAVYARYGGGDTSAINSETGAVYNNHFTQIDHACAIVGWDDNYSVTNFLEDNQPPRKRRLACKE